MGFIDELIESAPEEIYILEELTADSMARNIYLNAEKLRRQGRDAQAVDMFRCAIDFLEEELEDLPQDSPELKDILKGLYNSYQALWVETMLPENLRRIELPETSHYYQKKVFELARQLETMD